MKNVLVINLKKFNPNKTIII